MAATELEQERQKIYRAADESLFMVCFDVLRRLIEKTNVWWASEECDELWVRFRQMLVFNMDDVRDEGRTAFMAALRHDIYSLTDRVVESIRTTISGKYEYSRMRDYRRRPNTSAQEAAVALRGTAQQSVYSSEVENAIDDAFDEIWLKDTVTTSDRQRWRQQILDDTISPSARMMMMSALTLRLLRTYDEKNFLLLIETTDLTDRQVRARGVVGIVLLMCVYGSRIPVDTDVVRALRNILSAGNSAVDVGTAFSCLIRTFKTDEISRKITEEIYPEMMKSGLKLRNMMRESQSDNSTDDEGNPSWMQALDDSPIADKLREFSDMQMSGDDVYMSTFSGMKQYRFFEEAGHWFMPFDTKRVDIAALMQDSNDALSLFALNTGMCHSDKYSFFYTLKQLNSGSFQNIVSQMGGAGADEMREALDSEKWQESMSGRQTEVEIKCYAQDLFRFYRLFPRRSEFTNPFDAVRHISDNVLLLEVMPVEVKRTACTSLFKASLWGESMALFDYLDHEQVWDETFYQQHGYCAEQLGMWADALAAYEKADLVCPNDRWTFRHRALCYKKMGEWHSAIECYNSVLAKKDDDVSTIISLANSYIAVGQYDKARPLYYKADFLRPNQRKIKRLLAWCMFVGKQYDDALRTYNEILSYADPSADDCLNAGHVHMALHDKASARAMYGKALAALQADTSAFITMFRADSEWLIEMGCTDEDIAVVINQVLYQFINK